MLFCAKGITLWIKMRTCGYHGRNPANSQALRVAACLKSLSRFCDFPCLEAGAGRRWPRVPGEYFQRPVTRWTWKCVHGLVPGTGGLGSIPALPWPGLREALVFRAVSHHLSLNAVRGTLSSLCCEREGQSDFLSILCRS